MSSKMSRFAIISEEGNIVNVECSPNTALNILNDQNLRTQCFQTIFKEEGATSNHTMETFDKEVVPLEHVDTEMPKVTNKVPLEAIETTIQVSTDETAICSPEAIEAEESLSEGKVVWLDQHCQLLISLYKIYSTELGKSITCKNKTKMWSVIAAKMKEHGYLFTPHQIEGKWRGLEKSFRRKRMQNKKPGRSRITCKYEKELKDILLDKRSHFPQYTMNIQKKDTSKQQVVHNAKVAPTTDKPREKSPKAIDQEKYCQLLISLYKIYSAELGKSVACKNKSKMWSVISSKMKEQGYYFTPHQIEGKWRSLVRSFRNSKKNGRDRMTFEYEKELKDILADKPEEYPEFSINIPKGHSLPEALDNEGMAPTTEEDVNVSQHEILPCSNYTDMRQQETRGEKKRNRSLAEELRAWRTERKELHKEKENKKEQEYYDLQEYRRRKLELIEERNEELRRRNDQLQRKNDILEKLVDIFNSR